MKGRVHGVGSNRDIVNDELGRQGRLDVDASARGRSHTNGVSAFLQAQPVHTDLVGEIAMLVSARHTPNECTPLPPQGCKNPGTH
jgi:hypothetical protein